MVRSDVGDDQLQSLDRSGSDVTIPSPMEIEHAEPGGVSWTKRMSSLTLWSWFGDEADLVGVEGFGAVPGTTKAIGGVANPEVSGCQSVRSRAARTSRARSSSPRETCS